MNMHITSQDRDSKLAALAAELKTSGELARLHGDAWAEAMKRHALALAAAREMFPVGANTDFSNWLTENDLDFFGKDDRRALIEIGQHPAVINLVFGLDEEIGIRRLAKEVLPDALRIKGLHHKSHNPESEMDAPPEPEPKMPVRTHENRHDAPDQSDAAHEKPKTADSSEPIRPAPKPAKVIGKRPFKIVEVMGKHGDDGLLIRGFMPNGKVALASLATLASKPGGGVAAVKRLAAALRTGIAGEGHNLDPKFGPGMIFPNLPLTFVRRHPVHETATGLNTLIDDLPILAEIAKRLKDEQPRDPTSLAEAIWREKKGLVPPPAVPALSPPSGAPIPGFTGPDMSAFADGLAPYGASAAEAHFAPMHEGDIIVCGQVIYRKGSETAATFHQVYGAYGFFDLLDPQIALSEPQVRTRGYTWRRLAVWLRVANPIFGQAIWNIGNAMANHSEEWNKRSAPPKIPNGR